MKKRISYTQAETDVTLPDPADLAAVTAVLREDNDRAERLAAIQAEIARIEAIFVSLDEKGKFRDAHGLLPYAKALMHKRLTLEGMMTGEIGRA
jgi:hypothetical protein